MKKAEKVIIAIIFAIAFALIINNVIAKINEPNANMKLAEAKKEIVEKTLEKNIEEIIFVPEIPHVEISDVKISKDMNLTERTGLLKEDFVELINRLKTDKSGFFRDNAEKIYDLCEQYSINEIFFCGLIAQESGWNIAANHRRTNNFISLMSNGRLLSYSSVEEGLEVAAQKLHNNYLETTGKFYHGQTLSGVKVAFCPASSTWVDAVYGRMKTILY